MQKRIKSPWPPATCRTVRHPTSLSQAADGLPPDCVKDCVTGKLRSREDDYRTIRTGEMVIPKSLASIVRALDLDRFFDKLGNQDSGSDVAKRSRGGRLARA